MTQFGARRSGPESMPIFTSGFPCSGQRLASRVVLHNPHLTIWHYPEHAIVHHQFHQYMFGEPFRQGLMQVAELIRNGGATKWLSDDRLSSAVHPEDVTWADIHWVPLVRHSGWKHWAVIPPLKAAGRMNIKQIIDVHRRRGRTVELFSEPEEALTWLKRQ